MTRIDAAWGIEVPLAGPGHFSATTIAFAAKQGVPLATIAVPFSGVLALAGGLSILLGYHTRIGAWLLVLFLVPVTVMMHNFRTVSDPPAAQLQQIMFMKNVALTGGALFDRAVGRGSVQPEPARGPLKSACHQITVAAVLVCVCHASARLLAASGHCQPARVCFF